MENSIVRTDYDLQQGDRYRLLPKGDSTPTDPKWKAFDKELKARKRKEKQDAEGISLANTPAQDTTQPISVPQELKQVPQTLTPQQEIQARALNQLYSAGISQGDRHKTFMSETAAWLLFMNDNSQAEALKVAHNLDYIKKWKADSESPMDPYELENVLRTVSQQPLLRRLPKRLTDLMVLASASVSLQMSASLGVDPMADLPFDKWCDQIEQFFDVYPCLREVCEPHPRRLWPFLLFSSAAMMGCCMTLCYYKFYADPTQRCRLTYIILGVGDPTSGKGTLKRLMALLLAPILEADDIADKDTNEWKEKYDATGANREKETRHKIYNRFFGPRASNTEFIRSMINNKVVVDGEEMSVGCVTVDAEKDNSINMSKSGGWQNRDIMVLKSFHCEYDSQHYANKQSVSGRFPVVWIQIESCTPPTLKRLVNERNFNSGLDTRMGTIPTGKPDYDMMPLIREDDKLIEYNETLRQWAYKLDQRQGELPLWPLVEHVHKWCDERRAIAEFNDDQADWLLIKRVPYYGISVSAPYIDMRHWQEREETGTYQIDDTDRALCDLVLDIQYRTQLHWFYDLHRMYYDNQLRDAAQVRRRTNKFIECFRQLPEEFTTEKFAQVFGYANNRAGQKTLQRLLEDKAIERTMRGNYKKLVSEL